MTIDVTNMHACRKGRTRPPLIQLYSSSASRTSSSTCGRKREQMRDYGMSLLKNFPSQHGSRAGSQRSGWLCICGDPLKRMPDGLPDAFMYSEEYCRCHLVRTFRVIAKGMGSATRSASHRLAIWMVTHPPRLARRRSVCSQPACRLCRGQGPS